MTRSAANAGKWQSRLDGWILVAAVAAVVGVGLQLSYHHGPAHTAGAAVSWAVWTTFAAEVAVMLRVSPSPRLWIRSHRFELTVLVVAFPIWSLLAESASAARLVPALKLLKAAKFSKLAKAAKLGKSAKIIGKRSVKASSGSPGPGPPVSQITTGGD